MKKLSERIQIKIPEISIKYDYASEIQLANLLSNLEIKARFEGIYFVYGSGKRKTEFRLQ